MAINARFVSGTDFSGAHRRLTDRFGSDSFGMLKWGDLSLPAVRLNEKKFIVQETPDESWVPIMQLEGIEVIQMERYTSLPEKSKAGGR